MKLGFAIDDVQEAERDLAKQLVALAERHQDEPDVYHMSLARASACADHVSRMRPFVAPYEAHAAGVEKATPPASLDTPRQGTAAVLAEVAAAGLLLVKDLRDAYLAAHRTEISWIVLQQAAKAARDGELLKVVGVCAEEAEQTWKWLRTQIKHSAPQVLATK